MYEKTCSGCGETAVVDKRRLNCLCRSCSGKEKKTHGLSVGGKLHPLYKLLNGIKVRCNYPSASNYVYYGGRGISVCDEWSSDPSAFVSWAESKGWEPGLEVDRINSDGDYSPENCQLITHRENSQKTRRIKTSPEQARETRRLLASGVSINEAAKKTGVTYMVAWHIKNNPDVWGNV